MSTETIITTIESEIKRLSAKVREEKVSFRDLENHAHQVANQVGLLILNQLCDEVAAVREVEVPSSIKLADGSLALYQRRETRVLQSMWGEIRLERAYYWSPTTKQGYCPLDRELGLNYKRQTPKYQEQIGLLSAHLPFNHAERVLGALLNRPPVCAKTCANIAEDQGRQIKADYQPRAAAAWDLLAGPSKAGVDRGRAGPEADVDWDSFPDRPIDQLYLQVDGGRINTRTGWKEPKVGVIFQSTNRVQIQENRGELIAKRYVATFSTLTWFLQLFWLAAMEEGVRGARQVIVMGDGAPWIWNRCEELFPQALQILDFYHASEHLWSFAKIRYDDDSQAVTTFIDQHLPLLRAGKIATVLTAMTKVVPFDGDQRKLLNAEIAYFRNNAARMQYDRYENAGLFIGSGAVESGVKRVVNQRFKGCGMKWNQANAEHLLHLRAEVLSERMVKIA